MPAHPRHLVLLCQASASGTDDPWPTRSAVHVPHWILLTLPEIRRHGAFDEALAHIRLGHSPGKLPPVALQLRGVTTRVSSRARGMPLLDRIHFLDDPFEHGQRVTSSVTARSTFPGSPRRLMQLLRRHVVAIESIDPDQPCR